MIEDFRESELLEHLEDGLDADRARELDARLAADPGARAFVDALREDRAALRTTPAPALPADFVADLEPRLARALLMEPPGVAHEPGSYRRGHRRSARRRRVLRALAAAAVVTVALGGAWIAVVALSRPRPPGGEPIAASTPPAASDRPAALPSGPGPSRPGSAPAAGEPWPPPDAVVHHWGPLPRGRDALAPGAGADASADGAGGNPRLVAAPFALVLPAADADEAETLLRALLETPGDTDDVALVRNFSLAEASRLLAEARRADGAAPRGPGLITGTAPGAGEIAGDGPAEDQRRRLAGALRDLRASSLPEEGRSRLSRRLVGPEALAPTYEQQLELSERGATHTMTVPADRLAPLLARLRVDEGRATALRALDVEPAPGDAPLQQWLADLEILRPFVRRVREGADATYVLLPIRIESPSPR